MLSADTLRITCRADLSRSYEFIERGLTKSFGVPHWFHNVQWNEACFLKIDASLVRGKGYATVELSAQKAQNRNHVSPFNFAGSRELLDDLSIAVYETTGIEIDAANGTVTRCDFCYNWQLESELHVCSWLDVLREGHYPNLRRNPCEDTSVYFKSSAHTKNIFSGKQPKQPAHEVLVYAKSPQIREMIRRKQISKQDLVEVENRLRLEERLRSDLKIKRVAKGFGFEDSKPLTILSADFAEAVIMDSYKKLNLEKDVLGKDEREAALLQRFAPNGIIEDREARANFQRLFLTMKLADGIGGDNLLPTGVLTESVYYRNKSELYDLGLWSSTPLKGNGKRQSLKGLRKPIERRGAE